MDKLVDTIKIDSPPEPIWQWLLGLTDHYTDWHPDHVSAEWERGFPYEVGSILKAVEIVGGRRETLRFEIVDVRPPYGFTYRIRGPISVLLPGGGFEITPTDQGSVFAATIFSRFGRLTRRLFKRRLAALITHMREEGESLKKVVESS